MVTQHQIVQENFEIDELVLVNKPNDTIPKYIRIIKIDKAFGVVYYNNPQGKEGSTQTIGFAGISKIKN